MKKLAFVLSSAVLIGLSVFLGSWGNKAVSTDPKPIKVYSKDGVMVKAYDYNGFKSFLEKSSDTTYVINFWATWCAPCVGELPNFERITTQYKAEKVKVLLVSMDFTKQVEKSLLPFMKRKQLQSKVVLLSDPDANSWISKVDPNWSGALPATVIYNGKTGKRKFFEQSFTYEELNNQLKSVIPQS